MKKIRLIGVYDYTVVLTYISLVITLVGISLAIEGSFRSAVFCLALSGLCDMCRSILCATASVLVCFRQ